MPQNVKPFLLCSPVLPDDDGGGKRVFRSLAATTSLIGGRVHKNSLIVVSAVLSLPREEATLSGR